MRQTKPKGSGLKADYFKRFAHGLKPVPSTKPNCTHGQIEVIERDEWTGRIFLKESSDRSRAEAWGFSPTKSLAKGYRPLGLVAFLACLACSLLFVSKSLAQVLDGFAWVDQKTDTQTVARVAQFLHDKPYTAIREIGVAGQQALVITTLRKDPAANPQNDTFTAWGVSLRDGSAEELLDGANLRYVDWQKFFDYDSTELIALYDDCAECRATTFLTAFFVDPRTHRWSARWQRKFSGAPLYTNGAGGDPSKTYVYALFMNVDQRVVLDTWTSFPEQNKTGVRGAALKSSRGGEYLFEYSIDRMSGQSTSRPVTLRDAPPMKQRLCKGEDVVFGIAGGQESEACKALNGGIRK